MLQVKYKKKKGKVTPSCRNNMSYPAPESLATNYLINHKLTKGMMSNNIQASAMAPPPSSHPLISIPNLTAASRTSPISRNSPSSRISPSSRTSPTSSFLSSSSPPHIHPQSLSTAITLHQVRVALLYSRLYDR